MENTPDHLDDQTPLLTEWVQRGKKTRIGRILSEVEDRTGGAFEAIFNYLGSEQHREDERKLGERISMTMFNTIMRPALIAESIVNIVAMRLFRREKNNWADSLLDQTRGLVIRQAKINLPAYLELSGVENPEKIYVGGIVDAARGNSQLVASMRGIAWSLLAKDARQVLKERDKTIDGSWLFNTMGPLIRSGQNPSGFSKELSRFVSGDPEVIYPESAAPLGI